MKEESGGVARCEEPPTLDHFGMQDYQDIGKEKYRIEILIFFKNYTVQHRRRQHTQTLPL
jgi:hypothetical protein